VDFLSLDASFTQEELLVRQTARQFVDQRVIPLMRDCYRDCPLPFRADSGDGRPRLPGRQPGGIRLRRMSSVEYGLIMQELERGDSGVRSFVSVQGALVMYPIRTFGSEEQKQRWLPRLQSGEAMGVSGSPSPILAPIPGACAPPPVLRRWLGLEW